LPPPPPPHTPGTPSTGWRPGWGRLGCPGHLWPRLLPAAAAGGQHAAGDAACGWRGGAGAGQGAGLHPQALLGRHDDGEAGCGGVSRCTSRRALPLPAARVSVMWGAVPRWHRVALRAGASSSSTRHPASWRGGVPAPRQPAAMQAAVVAARATQDRSRVLRQLLLHPFCRGWSSIRPAGTPPDPSGASGSVTATRTALGEAPPVEAAAALRLAFCAPCYWPAPALDSCGLRGACGKLLAAFPPALCSLIHRPPRYKHRNRASPNPGCPSRSPPPSTPAQRWCTSPTLTGRTAGRRGRTAWLFCWRGRLSRW
jgi:hypothetical protein